jgi:hypothetical protein
MIFQSIPPLSGLVLVFLGCFGENRGAQKSTRPQGGAFDFSRMKLAEQVDFIELQKFGTLAYWGDTCGSRAEGKCRRRLDSLGLENGVGFDCKDSPCYHFIRTESQGKGRLWASDSGIKELLGPIDTEEEARLWIFVNGFKVIGDSALSVASHGKGFSITAMKMAGCPIVDSLWTLELASDGTISEKSRKLIKTYDWCY